jgi:hypothetical protein
MHQEMTALTFSQKSELDDITQQFPAQSSAAWNSRGGKLIPAAGSVTSDVTLTAAPQRTK